MGSHIEGETKWLPFSRRHLQMHFSWMKMYELRQKFHRSLFPRVQFTVFQHWFRQWLGADQAANHCLNQFLLIYWRIYASLGLNDLINLYQNIKATYCMECTLFTTYFVFPEVCLSLRPGDPLIFSTRPTSWTTSSSCFWAEIQPNSCCLHLGNLDVFLSSERPDFLKKKCLNLWASPVFLLFLPDVWMSFSSSLSFPLVKQDLPPLIAHTRA